jgi:hypothetical protein
MLVTIYAQHAPAMSQLWYCMAMASCHLWVRLDNLQPGRSLEQVIFAELVEQIALTLFEDTSGHGHDLCGVPQP